jgi:ABC-type nitrate/sulfonate/bicarbonate transport system substrate-binding protein
MPTHNQCLPSRRSFLGLLGGIGAAAALSPLLTACSGNSKASDGRYRIIHPSKDPLVVWAVTYLSEDEGYYKDEGLEIERVLLLGGPAALAGLLSGSGDALIATPGETLSAAAKGRELSIVMGHTNNMPSSLVIGGPVAERLGITADSPLEERRTALAKIDGGRYGITAPGSQTDAFTRLALRQAGLSADDVTIVPLQTASNCLAALSKGDIDGYIGVPPAGEQAITAAGAVLLLTAQAGEIEGADTLQGMCSVVQDKDLKGNKDLYEAAVRAETKAMKALNDDPGAAGELLRRTRFEPLEQAVWDTTWNRLGPSLKSPIVTPAALGAWLGTGLVDAGETTSEDIDPASVIDMGMTESAAKALSWTVSPA